MMEIVEKPWGHEEIWAKTKNYAAKVLFIKKGHKLSCQYHVEKEETIRVETGILELELGDVEPIRRITLVSGDIFHITPGMVHRMIAIEDVRIYEVSTPQLDDVVRLKDDYGRLKNE